jgi:hypothetical protein
MEAEVNSRISGQCMLVGGRVDKRQQQQQQQQQRACFVCNVMSG